MGFNGSGVYTPASGATTANPGDLIKSTTWNAIFTDLTSALTTLGQQAFGTTPATGSILSNSPSGGVGYATGAGGTVTQITSRTTGVTLNKTTGAITLFTVAPVVNTPVTFTVTNSSVAATDVIGIVVKSSNAANFYMTFITAVAAGSFNVTIMSVSGTTSDAPVLEFTVIKGVTA